MRIIWLVFFCACIESTTYRPLGSELEVEVDAALRELREGATLTIPVTIVRGVGSPGAVALSVEGLPAGVTAEPTEISADATVGEVRLRAQGATAGVELSVVITGTLNGGSSSASAKVFLLGKAGTIDTSFGSAGTLRLMPPDGYLFGGVGPQGTIHLVNPGAMKLQLLDADGRPDPSFGSDSVADYSSVFGALRPTTRPPLIAYQGNEKLVVIANYDDLSTPDPVDGFLAFRLLQSGEVDRTFGSEGVSGVILRTFTIGSIGVGPDGGIALYTVSSDFTSMLLNLSSTGQLLQSRVVNASAGTIVGLVVQPDRKIVAAASQGTDRFLTRFNSDLTPDSLFGTSGRLPVANHIPVIIPTSSDGYLVAGAKIIGPAKVSTLWSFDSQWQPTPGFSFDGTVFPDLVGYFPGGFEEDGKILLTSSSDATRVVQLRGDGSLDGDFAPNGTLFISYRETNDAILPLFRSNHSRALVVSALFNTSARAITRIWY
jgi:Domain of unknown function (DUF5122) beta-propeller